MRFHVLKNRILPAILAVCLILPLSPIAVSAEEVPLSTSENIVESGSIPSGEPGDIVASPSDVSSSTLLGASGATTQDWASGFPNCQNISDTKASLIVKSIEAGKVYFVRLADGATPPSAQQVKAGTDASNTPLGGYPVTNNTVINVANSEHSLTVSGLMPSTAYDLYTVLEDSLGVLQDAATLVEFTTTIPDAGNSAVTQTPMGVGSKQVQLTVTMKNAAGIASPGYGAADFSVKVDGVVKSFNAPPFSSFHDPDTGTYTVVYTGAEHNKSYTFSELTVKGYPVKTDAFTVTTPPETVVDNVCEVSSTPAIRYSSFQAALAAAEDGQTITLLKDTSHTGSLVIDSKTVTLNTGGFTLNAVNNNATDNEGIGLDVKNGGGIALMDNTGAFNVGGMNYGVKVVGASSSAEVTNITEGNYGAAARNGGKITVMADTKGVFYGASATGNGSTIVVKGDVSSTSIGINVGTFTVDARDGASVSVEGNVTANGGIPTGAYAIGNGSQIVVKGNVISTGNQACAVNSANGASISVRGNITANGTEGSLGAFADSLGEITIDGSITAATYIKVGDAIKTPDQMVTSPKKEGYKTYYNESYQSTVYVKDTGSPATPECAIGSIKYATLDAALAAVTNGQTITLLENINHNTGIILSNKSITLDLNGHILNVANNTDPDGVGLTVTNGSVALTGSGQFNVSGYYQGVRVEGNSNVTVTNASGALPATNVNSEGAFVSGGKLSILGSTTGSRHGAYVEVNGEITIGGNAIATAPYPYDSFAAEANTGGVISIAGKAEGQDRGIYVYNPNSRITAGSVSSIGERTRIAVQAESRGQAFILGNCKITAAGGTAVFVSSQGNVIVDGIIEHNGKYIVIYPTEKDGSADSRTIPTTKTGYHTYSTENGTVWVKDTAAVPTIPGAPGNFTTKPGDGNVTLTWDAPADNGGSPITAYHVSMNGGQWWNAGTMRSYNFSGLTNGTSYTFKVRAVNAAGNGAEASVTGTPTVVSYTVTFNLNGGTHTGSGALTQTVPSGGSAVAPTVTRSGYTFSGWDRAFTNILQDLTVNATWSYISSGGSSSGGGYTPPATSNIITDNKSNQPTIASMDVNASFGTNGNAAITITDAMAKTLIEKAQAKAKENGKTSDGIGVVLNSLFSKPSSTITITIEAAAIDRLEGEGTKLFGVNNPLVSFTLDTEAIKEANRQSIGNLSFHVSPLPSLSDSEKTLIGSRPVFGVTISYQKDDMTTYVSDFKKGTIILGIAYTPKTKEKSGNLYGVYMDKKSKPTLLTNSSYYNKRLIFSQNKLSAYGYGVGYKAPAPSFADTLNHWAKDNIDFVASRGLISGTDATTFSPDTAITRGDFLMALGKLSGVDVSGYKASSFTDVKATDPAMPYIEWAVKSKIVQGIGINQFGTDGKITREQMAVIMVNYAKATLYTLPVSRQAVTFADDTKISSWAKEAVRTNQQTGVINGKNGNLFDPASNVTRAEASTLLRRFIELVIDENTARGWVQNDSGQWQYINSDGSLARNTKVDRYEVDESGVRKINK